MKKSIINKSTMDYHEIHRADLAKYVAVTDKLGDMPLVRVTGVEPARLSAREPKSRMSANSIIPALYKRQVLLSLFVASVFTRRGHRGGALRLIHNRIIPHELRFCQLKAITSTKVVAL